jgi:L-threonylcarbamoyladenylate synthase
MSIISNCTVATLKDAATSLINGNLVAFPTETVYGLGADACNEEAVARIYEVKGRPTDHPLIVHISSMGLLDKWAREIPEYALNLARNFWPGPMTLILPRTSHAKDFITGGQDNVGIRVPSHTIALALLKEFEIQGGIGIAAPSANRFGAVSPTSAIDVEQELGIFLSPRDQILDGGSCKVGIESTIIDCTNKIPLILRPGAITSHLIQEKLQVHDSLKNYYVFEKKVKVSGSYDSHYSPKAKVFLTGEPTEGDGLIALATIPTPAGAIRLASPKNNEEFARELYGTLRSADLQGIKNIFVVLPSETGIGLAIIDRLRKSSYKGGNSDRKS